jgi:hypothetical protein
LAAHSYIKSRSPISYSCVMISVVHVRINAAGD